MAAPKKADSDDERHLTIDDFAARMGVAKQTVYEWNSAGLAPPRIKVGRHVCYKLAAVEAWEDARTIDGADPEPHSSAA